MNIFKPTTFTWPQLALLKWAVFLIGIAVGAYWSSFFAQYALWLLILGLLCSIYPAIVWLRK
jgi:hypothetical protein